MYVWRRWGGGAKTIRDFTFFMCLTVPVNDSVDITDTLQINFKEVIKYAE